VIVNEITPVLKAKAKKNKLTFIDLHAAFKNNDGKQMQRDGIHPTAEGAAQIAKIIAPYIKNLR
jgi:lysophospholipase L1-like esterase